MYAVSLRRVACRVIDANNTWAEGGPRTIVTVNSSKTSLGAAIGANPEKKFTP